MWTDQTVETLRKFALEGRSAAWIAAALGAPSRSAVIGKANRIGVKLNGAIRPSGEAPMLQPPPPETPWRQARAPVRRETRPKRPAAETACGTAVSRARTRVSAVSRERKRSDRWFFAAAEVGEMRRVAFMDVGEIECRWPVGDPAEDDFAYCGLQVAKGHAYCAGHCRLAYRRPGEQAAKRPPQNRLSWSAGFEHPRL